MGTGKHGVVTVPVDRVLIAFTGVETTGTIEGKTLFEQETPGVGICGRVGKRQRCRQKFC